jgi:hypothetical protein
MHPDYGRYKGGGRTLFVNVDPDYSGCWVWEPLRSWLIRQTQLGITVWIVCGEDVYLMREGQPTLKLPLKKLEEYLEQAAA